MNAPWLNAVRAKGWAVASSDYHLNAWGNARAVADVKALVAWTEKESGHGAKIFIAASMGSVNSLNAMLDGGVAPKCWYGVSPIVDLTTIGAVPNAATEIEAAYGSNLAAASNPATRMAGLPTNTKFRIL
jgi:alpha-beta hydrolase superfamily lysophospholipase